MQDKIILGLLLDGEKSSYDLKKSMESSTSFFYNSSQGSIQPALKKLVQNGHVEVTEDRRGARSRKVYSITEEGHQAFLQWAAEGIELDKPRDPALVKMFFFGYVDAARKIELVEAYLREIEMVGGTLKHFQRMNHEHFGQNGERLPHPKLKSRMDTLDFGTDYFDFQKDWYTRYLQKLKEELKA